MAGRSGAAGCGLFGLPDRREIPLHRARTLRPRAKRALLGASPRQSLHCVTPIQRVPALADSREPLVLEVPGLLSNRTPAFYTHSGVSSGWVWLCPYPCVYIGVGVLVFAGAHWRYHVCYESGTDTDEERCDQEFKGGEIRPKAAPRVHLRYLRQRLRVRTGTHPSPLRLQTPVPLLLHPALAQHQLQLSYLQGCSAALANYHWRETCFLPFARANVDLRASRLRCLVAGME